MEEVDEEDEDDEDHSSSDYDEECTQAMTLPSDEHELLQQLREQMASAANPAVSLQAPESVTDTRTAPPTEIESSDKLVRIMTDETNTDDGGPAETKLIKHKRKSAIKNCAAPDMQQQNVTDFESNDETVVKASVQFRDQVQYENEVMQPPPIQSTDEPIVQQYCVNSEPILQQDDFSHQQQTLEIQRQGIINPSSEILSPPDQHSADAGDPRNITFSPNYCNNSGQMPNILGDSLVGAHPPPPPPVAVPEPSDIIRCDVEDAGHHVGDTICPQIDNYQPEPQQPEPHQPETICKALLH